MYAESTLEEVAGQLRDAVGRMLRDRAYAAQCGVNARAHAQETHSREKNYRRMLEIYTEIAQRGLV